MAHARYRLTALQVRNIDTLGMHPDGAGLYLQVGTGGCRSWIFRYTLNKRTREMGLGSAHDFSLAEARERVSECRKLLAEGIDPIDERQRTQRDREVAREQAQRLARTFAECPKDYHQSNASQWKSAKHADQ